MRLGDRIRFRISSLLQGRYGVDALGRFLSLSACAVLLLALLLRGVGKGAVTSLLGTVAFAEIIWCYLRIFSRNAGRRAAENGRYLQLRGRFTGWFRLQRDRIRQRKEYAFFRCPGCRRITRVPRGKGRIRVVCRQCGYTFEKKT